MSNKYLRRSLVPSNIETFGSQPSSDANDSPKNFTPSLQSLGKLSSNRSDSSHYNPSSPIHHLSSVNDFKKSIEKEKSIVHLMNKFESITSDPDSPTLKGSKNKKVISVIEKNYALQIQTLLEQVNQLKLEKKIIEKKFTSSPARSRAGSRNELKDSTVDSSIRMTLGAKDSTINELEFQLNQLKNENSTLKMAVDSHKYELDKMNDGIREFSNLKCRLEDNHDEIELLKHKLEMKDSFQSKMQQELQQLRNENLHLKFKSQNNSFINCSERQTRLPSRDTSFISTTPEPGKYYTHNRTHSEHMTQTKSTDLTTTSNLKTSFGFEQNHHIPGAYSYSRKKEDVSQTNNNSSNTSFSRVKSRLSSLGPNPSLKMLNEYEKSLYKERQSNPEMQRKITNSILELKKLKSHCIEQENLRLMSILKEKNRPSKADTQNFRLEDSLIVGKSADLDLLITSNDNFEA